MKSILLFALLILSTSIASLGAEFIVPPVGARETEHFYYRLAPADGPYIDSQRGNKAFGIGVEEGKIYFSSDNAKSWSASSSRTWPTS